MEKGVDIEAVSDNVFTFQFKDEGDRQRVLSGSPWSFDDALIVMEIPVGKGSIETMEFRYADFWIQIHQVPLLCMSRDIGFFLGEMIGDVIEVDSGLSGVCSGNFLRIRVRIDITRALKRCLRLDILGDGT